MDKETKTSVKCISIILALLITPIAIGYYMLFCPHTTYFFFDRENLEDEFSLELTDDVKLISYSDDSFLIAIFTELIVEVDDAERFLKNNITCDIEEGDHKYGDDHKYSGNRRIYIRTEPHGDKYRVHLMHRE